MIKCPSCASTLQYDIESGMMKCSSCGNSYDPYLFEKDEKGAVMAPSGEENKTKDDALYETAVFICPDCGAELTYTDKTDVTAKCAYCGNANIIFDRIKNERRPQRIIPFEITKEECKKQYKKAARRAFLSPNGLKNTKCIDSFRGIYMPYWKYDFSTGGKDAHTVFDIKKKFSDSKYDYIRTYACDASFSAKISDISHDASMQFDDAVSESLAPYDKAKEKPFSPAFLSGFYAETDNVEEKNYYDYVNNIVSSKFKLALHRALYRETDNVKHISDISLNVKQNLKISRTMFPVWFMSYRNRNNKITYATVNGSTGKVVADFPVSLPKFFVFAAFLTAIFFLVFNVVNLMPRPQTSLIASSLFAMYGSFLNTFVDLNDYIKRKCINIKTNNTTPIDYGNAVKPAPRKLKAVGNLYLALLILMLGILALIFIITTC